MIRLCLRLIIAALSHKNILYLCLLIFSFSSLGIEMHLHFLRYLLSLLSFSSAGMMRFVTASQIQSVSQSSCSVKKQHHT